MNQVTLLGNLTKDPELKKSKDTDVSYTQFTLAVHERTSRREKKTYFIEVVAFHKLAVLITRSVTKGQQILVQGKIVTDSYINKEGEKVYTTKVVLEDFSLTGRKPVQKEASEEAVS
ncbi:MAG: single-stranded DNA-binding protein [Candidatus Niameybacter stercoravium]|nr:single-stranded DNA-binding protein [Candidatus Niameybacter stercoravium]